MASKSGAGRWCHQSEPTPRTNRSDSFWICNVDCSGTFFRTSIVPSTFTFCALRDTGVYDGVLWLVESSSARGLTADSDKVLPAVLHALSGYLGHRRCTLTNQLNLASTLLRPSSTCLSAQTHSQSVTWNHRQEATLDYQCVTLQSSLNSLKANLSNI